MHKRLLLAILSLMTFCCTASHQLSENELAKIEPRLRLVLEGKPPTGNGCDGAILPDGTITYSVLIRGDAGDIRSTGISPNSVIGDIITANITTDQLRTIAQLPSVRSVSCGSIQYPNH